MGVSQDTVAIKVSLPSDAWCGALSDAAAMAEEAAREALADADRRSGSPLIVGVILTDDREQRRLNLAYRGIDKSTNVLSFPLADPAAALPAGAPVLLGDLVLAFETVAREAEEQRKPLADHLQHLVVHGVLHLLGFDHENDTEARIMEAREVAILASLGVPDPYRDII